MAVNHRVYNDVLLNALKWAEARNYTGYSKFDALNSPLLRKIAGNSFLLRAGFIYAVSRSPVNIRPLLLVRKKQNPKGLALFARAYFNLSKMEQEDDYLFKAVQLTESLIKVSQHNSFSGYCWGYEHPWQSKAFYAPEYFPNTVVTVNAGEAILDAFDHTQDDRYLKIAETITDFVENDLTTIIDSEDALCSSYIPGDNWKVINVNALLGSYFARLYSITQSDSYLKLAKKYINWVISTQTDYGAWYYADPPSSSKITHDNYHTGFVLDSIFHYMDYTQDFQLKDIYKNGLEFYEKSLFTQQYAPKWMHNQVYPHDIHGVAQGIITFSKASRYEKKYLAVASKIADWGIENLYNAKGNFYYQKGKYITKKFTLMRWCQAWMYYALSLLNYKLTEKLEV